MTLVEAEGLFNLTAVTDLTPIGGGHKTLKQSLYLIENIFFMGT